MNIIYSDKVIKGLEGIYADASLFNGDTEICDAVYTDSIDIKSAYEKKGIQVFPIKKTRQTTPKKEVSE